MIENLRDDDDDHHHSIKKKTLLFLPQRIDCTLRIVSGTKDTFNILLSIIAMESDPALSCK
jgi:hypothetical protein